MPFLSDPGNSHVAIYLLIVAQAPPLFDLPLLILVPQTWFLCSINIAIDLFLCHGKTDFLHASVASTQFAILLLKTTIMATEKKKLETVEEYFNTLPGVTQKVLQTVRKTIQQAVPDAKEVISYQIPAFNHNGWIFYYSAYTKHYSLSCPPPFTVFEEFKKELAPYEISKSSIKFPLDKPVPVKLISAMAKFRAKQNLASAKKK
jgi:uncharacterized protein YdhG (YjbR/CyaY superfamily)